MFLSCNFYIYDGTPFHQNILFTFIKLYLELKVLTFKEFRGMSGYRPTACVPALEITKIVSIASFDLVLKMVRDRIVKNCKGFQYH